MRTRWMFLFISQKLIYTKYFFLIQEKEYLWKTDFFELVKNNKHKNVFNRQLSCVGALLTNRVWIVVCRSAVSENNLHGISNWYVSFLIKGNFLAKLFICEHAWRFHYSESLLLNKYIFVNQSVNLMKLISFTDYI